MRERVQELVTEALDKNTSLFLIDLTITEDHKIKVIIDGDQGVSLNDCIEVSRSVEHQLDRDEADFSLEVTSAGATEPLINARQFPKNIGRKLKVKTTKGDVVEGVLTDALAKNIKLSWKTREKKPVGKGKITVQKELVLDHEDILEAKVMITFN